MTSLWVCVGSNAEGQTVRFEHLGLEVGLSQNSVHCILQDRVGFIWLGTQDGLNRYDGHRFEVYKHDPTDSASLPSSWIQALLEDASGDLWIGTEGGGLSRWNRKSDSFTHFRHDPGNSASLSGERIRALHKDSQGQLWLGTFNSGLNRFDPASGAAERFRHDPAQPTSLSSDQVRAVWEDRAGRLWVGTLGGLDRLDRRSGTFEHFRHEPADPASLGDDRVRTLLEDRGGTLWVGTHGGLFRFDSASQSFVRYVHEPADPTSISHNLVRTLLEDDAGRLWVGTDDGLNLLRREADSFVRYQHGSQDLASLSGSRVIALHQDAGGVLWVGTNTAGVNKWNPVTLSFGHHRSNPATLSGLSSDGILAFAEDRDGRLWVGTWGGGLNILDRSSGRYRHFRHESGNPSSLSDDRVTALLHDRVGSTWIGTPNGLNRLDNEPPRPTASGQGGGVFTHYRHDPARATTLSNDGIIDLFEDSQGRLWVGTNGGGLNRFERQSDDSAAETFVSYLHDAENPQSVSNDSVSFFAEGSGCALWFGTFGGGLNCFEPDSETFVHYRHDPYRPTTLSNDAVLSLHVADDGTLWVGTQRGLNKLEGLDKLSRRAVFRRYYERDGLPNDVINGIQSDSEGMIWVSTNDGLSRFDPRMERFESYDASQGLQSNEFNVGASLRSPSGELFFGGGKGFNAFFPERIQRNTTVPPVVLTEFTRLNQPVDFGKPIFDVEEITLTYLDYFFSFEFAALDYVAPGRSRYRYKLEGFDDDWIDIGNRRRVTFTNLDSGSYVLRVKGSNSSGVWNREGASVRIVITPPFWRTPAFYLLEALIAASLLAGAFLTQRRRHERQKIEALQALDLKRKKEELAAAERWARELEVKNQEILQAQAQLIQSEKMAALGQLVAGVAHEINNPVNFISSGVPSLRRDVGKLAALVPEGERDQRFEKTRRRTAKLLEAIGDGAARTADMVKDLRSFARLDEAALKVVDLRAALDSTLTLLHHQTKDRIEVIRRYGKIPPVECFIGQLNQVFMNLLMNAVQAIRSEGTVTITTARDGEDRVRISIRDSGCGMTEEVREKIFDPFFTTKPVGQGTGLGLSISHGIVTKHGGTITVDSAPGDGAEFTITLPLRQEIA